MDFTEVLVTLDLMRVYILRCYHYRIYFLVQGLKSVDLFFDKNP
jgi:hypothetical protein